MYTDFMEIDLNSIMHASEMGGREVSKHFGKTLEFKEKSTLGDFRTKADIDSEKAILNIIQARFPTYNIRSEEYGFIDKRSSYTFIIDPLDGSNNFVLGIPNFAVSIGVMKNNEAMIGVIHLPILNQTYYALKGKGAFLKKKRLHVNKESDISRVTVSYTCGYTVPNEFSDKIFRAIHDLKIKRCLNNWSPASEYCLLAAGKLEAIINNANEIYDYTAGKVIAREAGGLITDFNGKVTKTDRSSIFIASNSTKIHEQLLECVQSNPL